MSNRKIFTSIAALFTLMTTGVLASAGETGENQGASVEKSRQYIAYADEYKKKADRARAEGKNDLADSYMKCAEAKKMIAEAYASGNKEMLAEGSKSYAAARNTLSTLERADKTPPSQKEKSAKWKDQAGKYEKSAADYELKAQEAEKKEKTQLAEIYHQYAAAYRKISEGYQQGDQEKVNAGFEEYKLARSLKDRMDRKTERKKVVVKKAATPPAAHNENVQPPPASNKGETKNEGKDAARLPENKLD